MKFLRIFTAAATAAAALTACSSNPAVVPPSSSASAAAAAHGRRPAVETVTVGDRAAAYEFQNNRIHLLPTRFRSHRVATQNASPGGFALDMTLHGGPTMPASNAYNIYVNCKDESCWGHPEEFLKGLTGTPFSDVIAQYTNGGGNKYTFKDSLSVKFSHAYSNTYYTQDIFAVLATALRHFKAAGLSTEYHIFLPRGVDTCFDQTTICYSPDNYPNWQFCAYHGSALYGKQPIVYSVEPFESPRFQLYGKTYWGCQNQGIPKGIDRIDSAQASALSHESFESWSDPIPNTGWYNPQFQMEIGDVCAYYFMQKLVLNGKPWYVQKEYSNSAHACVAS